MSGGGDPASPPRDLQPPGVVLLFGPSGVGKSTVGQALAEGFASAGFSSVIEGLEDACRPPSGWAKRRFPGRPALYVALTCGEEPLAQRLRERGGFWSQVPRSLLREWLATHASDLDAFDVVVDTSDADADRAAQDILGALPRARGFERLRRPGPT